jgi:2-iminobutanoate/2-iminopropanoate deaminase
MPREVISTPHAPEFASYSQAVKAGDTIYVAGTVGVDVATGELTRSSRSSAPTSGCRAA